MTLATCGEGRWAIVDGFPLLLSALVWITMIVASAWFLSRSRREVPARDPSKAQAKPAASRQTSAYKIGGGLLLLFGALGGFGPSISLLIAKGKVWSVNRQAPHTDADTTLGVHIVLAALWIVVFAFQLWTGGVRSKRAAHRLGGWLALGAVLLGVSLSGGFIWTAIHDFADGLRGPFAKAGIYTVALGIGAAVNAVLTGVYAKKRKFLLHKDFALMTLFWTLDPGVHRLYMWLMRLVCWDCWAPECTSGLGIAIAKLPANLTLIVWALVVASAAGRLNKIIVLNVAGQYLLWSWGTFGLLARTLGPPWAWSVAILSIVLGAIALTLGARALRGIGSVPVAS
jgi:hypothetical protein